MAEAEIKGMDAQQLQTGIADAREELFKLRFQLRFGQLTDVSRFRKTRRKVARMLTELRDQQRKSGGGTD
ncbi:hypothetical protein LBMAG37_09970 [Anaerolineae bacterium]|nr:50S ribosomal protein L29 [Anaerolineaceae bacterium]GDX67843.1 hypothetical protein LBMAG37_09970 [Anaerolineae bacterium]